MPVLNTTVIPGLDASTYDQIIAQVGPTLAAAPGFRSHAAWQGPDGWAVQEVWDSEAEFRTYFDSTVRPNLPPGVEPALQQLHNVVLPS